MIFDDFRYSHIASPPWISEISEDFENMIVFILIGAYQLMKLEKRFDRRWHETRFSAVLIGYMRIISDREKLRLLIYPEQYLYNEEILNGNEDPDTAPRIDICTKSPWMKENVYYGVEGKILVENNWGTRRASDLRRRYVDTGIKNFISERYGNGLIAGYVVEGNPINIIYQINRLLKHRKFSDDQMIKKHTSVDSFSDHYISLHPNSRTIRIRHLLLNFTM